MSAFFIAINRDKSAFSQATANAMLAQLDLFGADGKELIVKNNYAIGYQRFWTVPEEVGEKQPLFDSHLGLWLVFYGRVDNRLDLIDLLEAPSESELSDAELVLAVYKKLGSTGIKKIIGPFVMVLHFPETGKLLAFRDAMGGRYAVYKVTETHILISSYEMALVAHPSIDYSLNDEKVARVFANLVDEVPTSLISGLRPLNPGQQLLIEDSTQLTEFYLPCPKRRLRLSSDKAYADEFKRLLTQAVNRRLRAIKSVGTMLSGGMDSVPISILAAQELGKQGETLAAYSWVFDRHPEADERKYSARVCADFDIRPNWIACDDIWPKLDQSTHANPILPVGSPYSEFNQALLSNAQKDGVSVMLSGVGGDLLYTGTESILYELLFSGQWPLFFSEAKKNWRASGSTLGFFKRYVASPLIRKWLEYRHARQPISRDFLNVKLGRNPSPDKWFLGKLKWQSLRPQQYTNVLGSFQSDDIHYGKYAEAAYSIERRFPFRDRDLVEFMLSIPSDQLALVSKSRPIVKRAFESEFASSLLERNDKTNFTGVILSGINRDQRCTAFFNQKENEWNRYVKECYFEQELDDDGSQSVLKWQCGYYQFWKTLCYTPLGDSL